MVKMYDPRINEWRESDNPALILLYICLISCEPLGNELWEEIIYWANFCDEEVSTDGYKSN